MDLKVNISFKPKAFFLLLVMLCLTAGMQFTYAQVEDSEEESSGVLFLDSMVVSNQVVEMDSTFNYALDSTLAINENIIRAGLLYDVESNTIVWQKDMNYAYPIASVTKIMTAILAIQDIEGGCLNWNDKITVKTKYYKGRGRKKRTYYVNNEYSFRDIIKMLMIESNNYAANLCGEHVAQGKMSEFVKRMNEYAQALGMYKTNYSNPSGLPARTDELDNSASPHDLLLLALEALKYPELVGIAQMGYAEVSNGKASYTIRNHNGLVRDYQNEVDGLKTGFTRDAGFCIVTTSNRYNHKLICIVLGAPSVWTRNAIVSKMMNGYYEKIGLGVMGTRLPDSLLAIVKPGLTNEMFQYRSGPVTPAPTQEAFAASGDKVEFKTVYQKVVKHHKVRSGETLSGIADKYNCGVSEIKKLNRMKSTQIQKGQSLKVYATVKRVIPVSTNENNLAVKQTEKVKADSVVEKTNDTVAVNLESKTNEPSTYSKIKSAYVYHTVQKGDTLWNIAQRYQGVTVNDLKKVNRNLSAKALKPGTKVKVPVNR